MRKWFAAVTFVSVAVIGTGFGIERLRDGGEEPPRGVAQTIPVRDTFSRVILELYAPNGICSVKPAPLAVQNDASLAPLMARLQSDC